MGDILKKEGSGSPDRYREKRKKKFKPEGTAGERPLLMPKRRKQEGGRGWRLTAAAASVDRKVSFESRRFSYLKKERNPSFPAGENGRGGSLLRVMKPNQVTPENGGDNNVNYKKEKGKKAQYI